MTGDTRHTILHYTGYDDDAGGIVAVVRNLAADGRFACVLGLNRGAVQRHEPALPALELPRLRGEWIDPLNFWRARKVARAVQAWLEAQPRRIFHGHSRAGLLVGLWLHWWGERRVVVSVHCYGRNRWFYRWAAERLGPQLFWLSPAMRAYYGAPGVDWRQCIPGGVPPSRVTRPASAEGRLRLGGVGTLTPWKGWSTVIRALALLPEAGRVRVTFDHIGSDDKGHRAALDRLVKQCDVSAQVFFHGAEPSSDQLLGAVDVLVVASVNEPFSMAMLEALAAGVPVLAADSGGARDIIREGVNGRLYRSGDAAALAGLIGEWLARRPSWPVEQIRETAVTSERSAGQWADVYARL